jgi:hypothetical protein
MPSLPTAQIKDHEYLCVEGTPLKLMLGPSATRLDSESYYSHLPRLAELRHY